MPMMLEKDRILENPERLRDIKWLFEKLNLSMSGELNLLTYHHILKKGYAFI